MRAVNVDGNRVAMAELRAGLTALGFAAVRTYIQSGNVVLESGLDRVAVAQAIEGHVADHYGFESRVVVITPGELAAAIEATPFPVDDPKAVHLFFLDGRAPAVDLDGLRAVAAPGEAVHLADGVLYLYTPAGFGPSVLAAKLDRYVRVDKTGRNYRSAVAILELAALTGL